MALAIGALLALVVGICATVIGLDRDRVFYPTITIVIAFYHVLFAVMGGSTHALILELLCGTVFIVAAVVGFKTSLWIVAVALATHGLFDLTHGRVIVNPGEPTWWPPFCFAYDIVAAAYLAWLIQSGRLEASTSHM
jgi:hypothetical protein